MFFSVLTLGIASLLGACSNEEMPDLPNPQPSSQTNHLGLDRALEIVDGMMKELDGGVTRSSRKISTIEKVNTPTRSDADMPNWYVINYDNEAGFALINDAAIDCPVYGISNTGRLSMTDTLENKGLAMVLNNIFIKGYSELLSEDPNTESSSNSDVWGGGYFPGEPVNPSFPTDSLKQPWKPIVPPSNKIIISPLLTTYVQKWSQEEPFNVLCPTVYDKNGNSKKGFVGCGPLAMAMIMSHYQWPLSYYSASPNETYEFHWDEIRDYPYRYATSRLTREISRAYNMDAQWTDSATSVKSSLAPQTFKNFGYKKPEFKKFNEIALSTILDRVPILMFGDGVTKNGKQSGHMWVVDGLLGFYANDAGERPNMVEYFYHCVWGWGGKSNGYFSIYDYDSTDNAYIYDDTSISNKTGYTYFNFFTIGGLTPIK